MANRDLDFLDDFVNYHGAMLPGVRLPQINIEQNIIKI